MSYKLFPESPDRIDRTETQVSSVPTPGRDTWGVLGEVQGLVMHLWESLHANTCPGAGGSWPEFIFRLSAEGNIFNKCVANY